MVEIHNTVAKVFEDNKEVLEIFECKDEFSDTQNFCDHYGFDIEDSCNAILIKAKKPEEFYAMFCELSRWAAMCSLNFRGGLLYFV